MTAVFCLSIIDSVVTGLEVTGADDDDDRMIAITGEVELLLILVIDLYVNNDNKKWSRICIDIRKTTLLIVNEVRTDREGERNTRG